MSRTPPSHYAILELDPGATDDEIRRAYKRLVVLFDPAGPVVYGLYRPDELKVLLLRLKEAYDTLVDPQKRRNYDLTLYPEGHPSLRRADQRVAPPPPTPRPLPPSDPLAALELPPDSRLTGPILRRIREICHLSVEDVSEQTKISIFNLRAIEAEQYSDLPARVYVRGFLRQMAQRLRLDPERVLRDFLEGYDAWLAGRRDR